MGQRFTDLLPKRLAEFASGNPILWYQHFLFEIAIPHARLFAFLEAFGGGGVGVGLTLGLFTRFSALIGFLLSINFFLASRWMGFCQQGFHLVLAGCMLGFLLSSPARTYSIDALLMKNLNAPRSTRSAAQ